MIDDLRTASFAPSPVPIPIVTPPPTNPRHKSDPPRRAMFISYAFPPTGGGGVQRSVKFTKYLPSFGWRSTVLTAANPSVPLQDNDLGSEIDPSTEILRARTLEPSYSTKQKLSDHGRPSTGRSIRRLVRRVGMNLLQPDPQVLWNPAAMKLACGVLSRTPHDAIYATGPPFSSFLLARSLKLRFGLPLVVDFRDEWLLASKYLDNYQLGPIARRRQRSMMNKVLRSADVVIATTQASADELESCCTLAGSRAKVSCIYNGYDHEDVQRLGAAPAPADLMQLVYTGTLWKLTDISPVVSSLESLASKSTVAARRIELVLAGRRTPQQEDVLARLENTPVSVTRHDYLPHRSSLQLASSAGALLLLLADEAGSERVVPAKLFEYMALRRPILAICPPGETAELLRRHGHTSVFAPSETEKITNWFISSTEQSRPKSIRVDTAQREPRVGSATIDHFSRRELTRQLADLLETAVVTA